MHRVGAQRHHAVHGLLVEQHTRFHCSYGSCRGDLRTLIHVPVYACVRVPVYVVYVADAMIVLKQDFPFRCHAFGPHT